MLIMSARIVYRFHCAELRICAICGGGVNSKSNADLYQIYGIRFFFVGFVLVLVCFVKNSNWRAKLLYGPLAKTKVHLFSFYLVSFCLVHFLPLINYFIIFLKFHYVYLFQFCVFVSSFSFFFLSIFCLILLSKKTRLILFCVLCVLCIHWQRKYLKLTHSLTL